MTRERLEELVKQRATVYCPMNNDLIVEYDLSLFKCRFASDEEKVFACIFNADHEGGCYHLRDIFETRERALWHIKTCAKHVERFEPPMWEDIKNEYSFKFVVDQILYKFIVTKNNNAVGIYNATTKPDLFTEPATKENYEKACEVVRDLFKERL